MSPSCKRRTWSNHPSIFGLFHHTFLMVMNDKVQLWHSAVETQMNHGASSTISNFDCLLLFLDFNFLLPSFSFNAPFSLSSFSSGTSLAFSLVAFFFFFLLPSSFLDAFFLFTGSVSSSSLISVSFAICSAFSGGSTRGVTSAQKMNEKCIISRCGITLTLYQNLYQRKQAIIRYHHIIFIFFFFF
jgi:hypothetical protein